MMAMSPTYRTLPTSVHKAMFDVVPAMVARMRERGSIDEAFMDMHNIPVAPQTRKTPQDSRVLYQQRATVINGQHIVEQYREYLETHAQKKQRRLEAAAAAGPGAAAAGACSSQHVL